MALIKCSNCNHEISDTLNKCIHCGTKVQKQVPIQNEIQNIKKEENIKVEEKVKENTKPMEASKKVMQNNLKEKKQLLKKKRNYKPLIIGIVSLFLIIGISTLLITTYNWLRDLNYMQLKEDNQTSNENVKINIKNLNVVLEPKVVHNQNIENNQNIVLNMEIENGKSAIFTIDIENASNKDITFIDFEKKFTCNSDTSYTCFESIDFSWQDNKDTNIVQANSTRTIYIKILTTGKEENGVIKIRLTPKFDASPNNKTNNDFFNQNETKKLTLLTIDNCIYCDNLKPIIEEIASEYGFNLEVKNYKENELSNTYKEIEFFGYPTLFLFDNENYVTHFEGYAPKEEIIVFLKENNFIKE